MGWGVRPRLLRKIFECDPGATADDRCLPGRPCLFVRAQNEVVGQKHDVNLVGLRLPLCPVPACLWAPCHSFQNIPYCHVTAKGTDPEK